MAATINFTGLTDLEKARIMEVTFDAIINNLEFNAIHNVYTGIKAGDSIGFLGQIDLMMKAAAACGTKTPHVGEIPGVTMTWAPVKWEVFLRECGTDMDHVIKQWGLKYGTSYDDRTGTMYEDYVSDALATSWLRNFWRAVWMNDTAAATVTSSPAGVITAGTDVTFFNWCDGYFKLMWDLVTLFPARRTTLTGNEQATYALQESVFTDTVCETVLSNLERNADQVLRQQPNKVILCTQSVADRYIELLEGRGQEPAYSVLVGGLKQMTYHGIPLIVLPFWDDFIRAYEDDGTRYNYPHRAVLTVKENLAVGTQDTDTFDRWDMWYDPETEYNYSKAKSDVDIHVMRPNLFQFAY